MTGAPGGAVVVSLDTELAWGYHPSTVSSHISADGSRERANIQMLLNTFEALEAPATWAIVGHLFLETCDGMHANMERPMLDSDKDWYESDPGTSMKEDPLRYGADIVDAIIQSPVEHEIGTHTFSHIPCEACGPEVLRSELRECRGLARDVGHELTSIVYPRNRVGHREVLLEEGITIYRGVGEEHGIELPGLGNVSRYLRFLSRQEPTLVSPTEEVDGLWNLPGSQYLAYPSPHTPLKHVSKLFGSHPRVTIAKRGIANAKRTGKILHLWAHPHDFTMQGIRDLGVILEFAKEQSVPILTMKDAVHRYQ